MWFLNSEAIKHSCAQFITHRGFCCYSINWSNITHCDAGCIESTQLNSTKLFDGWHLTILKVHKIPTHNNTDDFKSGQRKKERKQSCNQPTLHWILSVALYGTHCAIAIYASGIKWESNINYEMFSSQQLECPGTSWG